MRTLILPAGAGAGAAAMVNKSAALRRNMARRVFFMTATLVELECWMNGLYAANKRDFCKRRNERKWISCGESDRQTRLHHRRRSDADSMDERGGHSHGLEKSLMELVEPSSLYQIHVPI